MNIANLNKNNTKMPFKQLCFILTILLLLFTFSFACAPAVNPPDKNDEKNVFTPSSHIKVSDGSTDITESLDIKLDENVSTKIIISGLSNAVTEKTYTLTITSETGVFSTQGNSPISINIADPTGFSPGVVEPPSGFTITNDIDPSKSITYTVEVQFSGALMQDWLTSGSFATYFTGATYAGQTATLSFDGSTIAIGGGIINVQDGNIVLTTAADFPTGYSITGHDALTDPDKDGIAALKDGKAGTITIAEDGNPEKNNKTYPVRISLEAYESPVMPSHVMATFNGNTASNIVINGVDIIISGFINIDGSTGTGSVTITQPTTGEFTVENNPFSLTFNDPDGTNIQDKVAGTVSVTSDGVTVVHTIKIIFSGPISLKITSDKVPSGTVTILKDGTVNLIGLGACELLPPPNFEIDGINSVNVIGFPSYFDRRTGTSTGLDTYTVNRDLIIEDANGIVLDAAFTVRVEGFPACDEDDATSIFTESGDDANPIEIDSAPELELLSYLVENDNTTYASKSYKLTTDIDLGSASLPWSETASGTDGEGFPPIGLELMNTHFQGTFDCANNSISNLYINKAGDELSDNNIGLIGYAYFSSIQNCRLVNVKVKGNDKVGGLVGHLRFSNLTNSYATGDVEGTYNVGGLVGTQRGASITNSYATSSVTGTGTAEDEGNVGGLVGSVLYEGITEDSPSIENSYATGNVEGSNFVGGLVGYLHGFKTPNITNSYATGNVTGTNFLGGLVGRMGTSSVTNSYVTGLVSRTGSFSGEEQVGGFVGFVNNPVDDAGTITFFRVTNSYYDSDTGETFRSPGGESRTTNDLQSASGPTSASGLTRAIYTTWDTDVWQFDPVDQYPRLKPVVCANRQYADPNDVPTACEDL